MRGDFLRAFWLGFLINLGALAFVMHARQLGPVYQVRLSATQDRVVVWGFNKWGLRSIKTFASWNETQDYLRSINKSLPFLSYAERGTDLNAHLDEIVNLSSHYFRVRWNEIALPGAHPPIIHAPDQDTAETFVKYLRYSRLEPSVFGFSLPAE